MPSEGGWEVHAPGNKECGDMAHFDRDKHQSQQPSGVIRYYSHLILYIMSNSNPIDILDKVF